MIGRRGGGNLCAGSVEARNAHRLEPVVSHDGCFIYDKCWGMQEHARMARTVTLGIYIVVLERDPPPSNYCQQYMSPQLILENCT